MKAIALLFLYLAMICSATSATAQQEPPERNRDIEMVRAFLDRGAVVDWPDPFGRTTLWQAVRDSNGCYPSR